MPKIAGYRGWRVRPSSNQFPLRWDFIMGNAQIGTAQAGNAFVERRNINLYKTEVWVRIGGNEYFWRKSFANYGDAQRAINAKRREVSRKVFKKR